MTETLGVSLVYPMAPDTRHNNSIDDHEDRGSAHTQQIGGLRRNEMNEVPK